MHVKGLEYPAYRPGPRSPGFGLTYAITERGACHRRGWPVLAEQALEPFSTKGRAGVAGVAQGGQFDLQPIALCDFM